MYFLLAKNIEVYNLEQFKAQSSYFNSPQSH